MRQQLHLLLLGGIILSLAALCGCGGSDESADDDRDDSRSSSLSSSDSSSSSSMTPDRVVLPMEVPGRHGVFVVDGDEWEKVDYYDDVESSLAGNTVFLMYKRGTAPGPRSLQLYDVGFVSSGFFSNSLDRMDMDQVDMWSLQFSQPVYATRGPLVANYRHAIEIPMESEEVPGHQGMRIYRPETTLEPGIYRLGEEAIFFVEWEEYVAGLLKAAEEHLENQRYSECYDTCCALMKCISLSRTERELFPRIQALATESVIGLCMDIAASGEEGRPDPRFMLHSVKREWLEQSNFNSLLREMPWDAEASERSIERVEDACTLALIDVKPVLEANEYDREWIRDGIDPLHGPQSNIHREHIHVKVLETSPEGTLTMRVQDLYEGGSQSVGVVEFRITTGYGTYRIPHGDLGLVFQEGATYFMIGDLIRDRPGVFVPNRAYLATEPVDYLEGLNLQDKDEVFQRGLELVRQGDHRAAHAYIEAVKSAVEDGLAGASAAKAADDLEECYAIGADFSALAHAGRSRSREDIEPLIARATHVLAKHPDVREMRVLLSSLYGAASMWEECYELTQGLIADELSDYELAKWQYQAGQCAIKMEEWDEAERHFTVLAGNRHWEEGNRSLHVSLGLVYLRTDQLDEAEEAYNRALQIRSTRPPVEVHVGLSDVFVARGDYEQALTHIDRAIRFAEVDDRADIDSYRQKREQILAELGRDDGGNTGE